MGYVLRVLLVEETGITVMKEKTKELVVRGKGVLRVEEN